ncbi:MAG: methionine adenosyltransferase [Candidatus Woesearchaeota archaeon]
MRTGKYLFTSECVTEGHPDKVCDQIADEVLDRIIKDDATARVACEVLASMGFIIVTGEITTKTYVDVRDVVESVLRQVGYNKPEYGFDYRTVAVLSSIHAQSPDIAQGVNAKKSPKDIGAGDQGMMSGYATNETPEMMPFTILYAQKLARRLTEVRKSGILPYLRPDGKTQVTAEYENGKPKMIKAVVIAAQHDEDVDMGKLREDIKKHVIEPVCGKYLDSSTEYYINNTGRFVIGGPVADTGCTGRKIIADTYGGVGNHGGGSFSGKDPTKVDKSGAYMARYISKNVVAAGIAEKCEVQLAYVIGGREPLSFSIDTFGTSKIPEEKICEAVRKHFDLSPGGMIEQLNLRRPIYRKTSVYGHFGRDEPEFTWERTDKAELLRKEVGL